MLEKSNILSSGDLIRTSSTHGSIMWTLCCAKTPKDEIIYCCQLAIAVLIIVVGLRNITFTENDTCLWSTLVSGAVCYLLPSPQIHRNESLLPDSTVQRFDEVPSR